MMISQYTIICDAKYWDHWYCTLLLSFHLDVVLALSIQVSDDMSRHMLFDYIFTLHNFVHDFS